MKPIVAFETLLDAQNPSASSIIDKNAGAYSSMQVQRGAEEDENMNDGVDSDLCSP